MLYKFLKWITGIVLNVDFYDNICTVYVLMYVKWILESFVWLMCFCVYLIVGFVGIFYLYFVYIFFYYGYGVVYSVF